MAAIQKSEASVSITNGSPSSIVHSTAASMSTLSPRKAISASRPNGKEVLVASGQILSENLDIHCE